MTMAKLFYKIEPSEYRKAMNRIRDELKLHEEIDEEKTILIPKDETQIEHVVGSYDPMGDKVARVRVILIDTSLRDFFNSVLGEPYKEK
jgi:hypothetical protein